MAHMLRCLLFLEARFEIMLMTSHVAGVDNGAADAISRNKLDVFFNLVPQASQAASPVPPGLVAPLVSHDHWTCSTWKVWLETLSRPQ